MKTTKKNYGKVAAIIAFIATIAFVIFLLLEEKNPGSYILPGGICLAVGLFAFIYSLLSFSIREDEKNQKDLSPEEKEERDKIRFSPENYPWF